MPAQAMTIKIHADRDLMERIERTCLQLDTTPVDFIEFAIQSELTRQEMQRQMEDEALERLRHGVLASGQGVAFQLDEEAGEHAVCQLCLSAIPTGRTVDGPMLCDSCYALAKGDR